MTQKLKNKAVVGLFWSFIEKFSAKGVQFILGIVLARLLCPEVYGLVGMITVFIAISESFIDSGFSQALVQKQSRDELDYSTTFYFNFVVAVFVYVLLYIAAPFIADFYEEPDLVKITRVISLAIIISSFGVVQRAKYMINIDFKTQTKASMISIVVSGVLGIYMAYSGYGVWALVVQNMTRRALNVLVLWWYSKWIPQYGFSYNRFKQLFSFGSKLLVSGLINTIFKNIYTLLIGKAFSTQTLGYYTRSFQFASFPATHLTSIVGRVIFPVLSEMQDDDERLRKNYVRIIKLTALFVFPVMLGIAALSKPLILYVLTDKWSESVWMLQILCFAMMWYPVQLLNLNVITVKGRTDLFLKLEIIKKIVIVISLAITLPIGIKAMLIGSVVNSYIALMVNSYYTKKLINYGFWEQMKDLLPILLLSFVMGAGVYALHWVIASNVLLLLVGTLAGAAFYLGVAWSGNFGEIRELKSMLKLKK